MEDDRDRNTLMTGNSLRVRSFSRRSIPGKIWMLVLTAVCKLVVTVQSSCSVVNLFIQQ